MKMRLTVRGIAMVLMLGGSVTCRGGEGGAFDLPAAIARSQVSTGDTARLQHALAKARRGEAVAIGVMGGILTRSARCVHRAIGATAEQENWLLLRTLPFAGNPPDHRQGFSDPG